MTKEQFLRPYKRDGEVMCAKLSSAWDAAWAERGRVDAEIAKKHSQHYFSQMEGQGQPDFQICEFAMIACQHVEVDIRALDEKGEK